MKKSIIIFIATAFNMAVTIAFILLLTIILSLFVSCSSANKTRRHDPVKTPDTWRKTDNGGCGWTN